MRNSSANVIASYFGGITQADSRSNSSRPQKVFLEYKSELPNWNGHAGHVLTVSQDGQSLEWKDLKLDLVLQLIPKIRDNESVEPGQLVQFKSKREFAPTPLRWTGRSFIINKIKITDWAAAEIGGDLFLSTPDSNESGLRIQTDVDRDKYGLTDRYGNKVIFTNEQGSSNVAMMLGDVRDSRSNSVIFGISLSQNAETPSTGDESWLPRLTLSGSGNLWIAGSIFQSSDERLKKNIKELEYDLEDILKLKPVRYQMIDDEEGEQEHIGLIAQEVEKIIPEVVSSIGQMKSIAYDKLVPVLIKAIHELANEKNIDYSDTIDMLMNEVEYLRSVIDILTENQQLLLKEIESLKDHIDLIKIDQELVKELRNEKEMQSKENREESSSDIQNEDKDEIEETIQELISNQQPQTDPNIIAEKEKRSWFKRIFGWS